MLLPTLPPLASAPLSGAARQAYVLRHFRLAYPGAPAVSVGGAGTGPQVEIADLGNEFFAGTAPYPPPPGWRSWQGRQVPFFFDSTPEKPLLVLQENKAIISADIISAAFYLLSGWQEYFSSERDYYGRFPYAASVQKLYNFVTLPVVNYYFDVLKNAVEHVSGQPLQKRRWGNQRASFAAFISHDIDNLRSAWKTSAKKALSQQKFFLFGKLLWQHLTRPDAWDNLEEVAEATARYGAKSTFFILPTAEPATTGTPNADYSLTTTLQQRFDTLRMQGCPICMHGSLGTATNAQKLHDEAEAHYLVDGLRFHYLSWEPRLTPRVVHSVGFQFDSTLGFAEHFGFRNSYCQPFYPFDFTTAQALDFLEIPLVIMDTTLCHPKYLQVKPAEILPALQPIIAEIKRFGGVVSLLWHNQNFDPANSRNGPRQFHELMAYLLQQGAAFLTGRKIVREFSAEMTEAAS